MRPTPPSSLAEDLIADLLRSAWVIERSRASTYRMWAAHEERFAASAGRSEQRAAIVRAGLDKCAAAEPGVGYTGPHGAWMRSVVGEVPGEVPLAEMLLARLGDWVQGHAGHFLARDAARLEELGDEERSTIVWPGEMPPPPPYRRLARTNAEPPGAVRFRFGLVGDLHIGSPGAEELVAAAISDLNASGAELVIQMGDLADHGERSEMEAARELLSTLQVPTYVIIGNHDVFSVSSASLTGRDDFAEVFGRPADGELFEHGGVKFALLDSADNAASPFAPFNLVTGTFVEGPGGAVARGSLTWPQHDILAEVAGPGAGPAFVFLHHPPQPFTAFPPLIFGLNANDSGRLQAVCDSGNVWGVFAGHTHRNSLANRYGNVPLQEIGVPRDYPFGYALVDVAGDGYAYNWHQISDDALLEHSYAGSSAVHRRYSGGRPQDRAWTWHRWSSLPVMQVHGGA